MYMYNSTFVIFNPFALRPAKTLWPFFACNRVKCAVSGRTFQCSEFYRIKTLFTHYLQIRIVIAKMVCSYFSVYQPLIMSITLVMNSLTCLGIG